MRKTPPKDSEHGALTRPSHHNLTPKASADSFNQRRDTRHPLRGLAPLLVHYAKQSVQKTPLSWFGRDAIHFVAHPCLFLVRFRFSAVHRNAHHHLGRKCCGDPRQMTGERVLSATKATPLRMPHVLLMYGQARANAAKANAAKPKRWRQRSSQPPRVS